jgi:lysozyme
MVNNLSYSKRGQAITESFESCRLKAYPDVRGVWTIGYGHTDEVHPTDVISQHKAVEFLLEDIQTAVDAVNRLVTVPLTQDEFDALADFTFNVGIGALAESTLLRDINAEEFKAAADQLLLWDHANGKVIVGLLRRRIAEQSLFNGIEGSEIK